MLRGTAASHLPPLQGDDCPLERLEEGQDPAHANWWSPWHQPLDTLGLRNSGAGSLDVRAPLKSHKLPGDGHEGHVAGHTGRKRTTRGEDTKAGATGAHGSTVHDTRGQKKGILAIKPGWDRTRTCCVGSNPGLCWKKASSICELAKFCHP